MLNLYLNKPIDSEYVACLENYFEGYFEEDWLKDDLLVEVIEKVDNIKHYGRGRFDSEVLGVIGVNDISGTAKCLISACVHPTLLHPIGYLADDIANYLKILSDKYDMLFTYCYNGFKFAEDQVIHVIDWNEDILGKDFHDEVTKHDDWGLLAKGLQFQISKDYI